MSTGIASHSGEILRRIAIVGRPNVGKSTLLNRMCNSLVSIVEPTAGVTRDRIAVPARLSTDEGERWFEVIDTGGIGIVDRDDLGEQVEAQVRVAVENADLVLFLVDVRDGLTPLDHEVAKRLRGAKVPVFLLANKCEGRQAEWGVDEFRRLGFAEGPFPISAQNGNGMGDLYERIAKLLPRLADDEQAERPVEAHMKLAVVGCRNAGKSTLINALAGEERMIVSEIPGTTRDAVDVRFERDGKVFIAIDTAGVRKKAKMADAIEFFSDSRSHRTIRRADVVLHLFDTNQELSQLDKKLARYVVDHHKPVILCANKWDLVADMERQDFVDYIRAELPGVSFAPLRFLSAKTGHGVEAVLKLAQDLYERSHRRVGTGELNRVLQRASESRSPSAKGASVRIYYATQVSEAPPTITLFVNDKHLLGKSYLRFLQNRLREELDFGDLPLRLLLRDKKDGAEE